MPSYPAGTLESDVAPIDAAIINSFRYDFRNTWIKKSQDFNTLDDMLIMLVWPALYPMSDDIRTSYQMYLPSSVWEDLPRQPGTVFGVLVKHFEYIQKLYLADQAGATLSWVRVIYYMYFGRWLLEQNDALEIEFGSVAAELNTVLNAPNRTPEAYIEVFELVVAWIKSQALSMPGFNPNAIHIWHVDGVFLYENHVSKTLLGMNLNILDEEPASELSPPLAGEGEDEAEWDVLSDVSISDLSLSDADEEPEAAPTTMSHEQAAEYVTGLEVVDMAGHELARDRCPFCWSPYDGSDGEPNSEDPNDLTVCKTPCDHLFHRGCLAQILEGSSTLCPVCATELNV